MAKRTRSNCFDNKVTATPIVNPYHFAFTSKKYSIFVIDPVILTTCFELKGHVGPITWIHQLRNGYLASQSYNNNTIRIWNLVDASQVCWHPCQPRVSPIELDDGRLAFAWPGTGHRLDGSIVIWDFMNGTNRRPVGASFIWDCANGTSGTVTLRGHTARITLLVKLKDGHILTHSRDNTIRVWNTQIGTEREIAQILFSRIGFIIQLQDGRVVISTRGRVVIWKFWELTALLTISEEPTSFYRTPLLQLSNGNLVWRTIDPSYTKTIRTMDVNSHEVEIIEMKHTNSVQLTEIDTHRLAFINSSNVIILDIVTKERIKLEGSRNYSVRCIKKISNNRLVSASCREIRIWNLNNLHEPPNILKSKVSPSRPIPIGIQELPGGRLLVQCQQTSYVWDIPTKTHIKVHGSNVCIVQTPDDLELSKQRVRDALDSRLVGDICDIVSDFVSPSSVKRQKTKTK